MPALALSDVLQDFGSRDPGRRASLIEPEPAPLVEIEPEPAPVDVNSVIAAEIAKAEAQLTDRLSQIYENTLQAERDQHAAEIGALEARLGGEAAALIAARLADMERRVTELTAAATARILAGVLSDHVQKRSVDSLALAIREATSDREAVRIKVRGPQSLYEPLVAGLGTRATSLDYSETSGFDLTVEIDGSLFETRLSEWSSALSEVLA